MNETDDIRIRTRQAMRSAGGVSTLLILATVAFLLIPARDLALDRVLIVTVVFVLGLAGVAALVVRQVIAYQEAPTDRRGPLVGLLAAVYLTVLFFALAYYALATSHPEQIEGLQTRTDALYYALSIVSTVGLGDVHAVGQAARAITSLHMVFDLVFVSLALAAVRAPTRPDRAQD